LPVGRRLPSAVIFARCGSVARTALPSAVPRLRCKGASWRHSHDLISCSSSLAAGELLGESAAWPGPHPSDMSDYPEQESRSMTSIVTIGRTPDGTEKRELW